MKQNKIIQNIFLFPFLMTFLQFVFLFVSLFSSKYYFENKVLLISGLCVCIWGVLFLSSFIHGKAIEINFYNIIIIFLFAVFCILLIRRSWFSLYLRIDAVKRFFEGRTFIDTLYHSAIAESIVTNGYPSIQQNTSEFLAYHCLSHYIVAGISKILNIPCFITYNYLFPVFFFPILLLLTQKVITTGKQYFLGLSQLVFSDYIILIGCLIGFFIKNFQKDIACNIHSALFNSESCLIAVVILLLYFYIIDKLRNIKAFEIFNYGLLIPIFIILLSYAKISFGLIFTLGASYFAFRKYFFHDKKWLFLIELFLVFYLYYYFLRRISVTYPSPGNNEAGTLFLFHHVRSYTKGKFYIFLHYLFLFFPIMCTIYSVKDRIFKKIFYYKKDCVFIEMCFLLMIAALLPGIFMVIQGGSSFYFVIPVYIFSWLLFISCDAKKIFTRVSCIISNGVQCIFKESLFVVIILILSFGSCFNDMHLFDLAVQTTRSRISLVGFRKDVTGKMKELFKPVIIPENSSYWLFNQIRGEISHNPDDYCVFLSDDSTIIETYDNKLDIIHPHVYYCKPYLAVSAYLGLPVINSIYEQNGYFYRGDGKIYGDYRQTASYSLPPALCDKKITKDNMIERAKQLGKKYIIVIEKNYYTIVNVN